MGGRGVLLLCQKGCKLVFKGRCHKCDCPKNTPARRTRRFATTKLFKPPQKPAGKTTTKPAAKTTGKGKVEETSSTICTGKGKKRVCKTIVTRRLCTGEGETRNAWKSNPLPVKQRKSLPPKQQPKKSFRLSKA